MARALHRQAAMYSRDPLSFQQTLDEGLDGPATSDALDAELQREIISAASRGPDALEGLLACLDSGQRSAAFRFLQSEAGNHATARGLGRKSAEEENYLARRAALDATPVMAPRDAAREVTERAKAEVSVAPAATETAAPAATAESNAAMLDSIVARADALTREVKEERDNHAAREAYLAKKYEGNDLMARAMARVKRKSS
jgi:hypothetical protein